MVLYCIDAPVFLGYSLFHRYAYNRTETAVLMIDERTYKKRDMMGVIQNMLERKIFDDIVVTDMFCDVKLSYDKEKYQGYVIAFYDKVFEMSGYSVKDFEKIYCINDIWDGLINLYFNLIQREYIWVAANAILYNESLIECSNEFQILVDEYRFLTPLAPYAKVELASGTSQEQIKKIEKEYSLWDRQSAIDEMLDEDLKNIMECYETKNVREGSWVLVLNSYGSIRYDGDYSYRVQKLIELRDYPYAEFFSAMNNTALDYYIPEMSKVYIKSHPNDPISDEVLERIYGGGVENLSSAPFELLEKYLNKCNVRFDGIIAFDSTSTQSLNSNLYANSCVLGTSFHRTWFYYDSLYVVSRFAQYINKKVYTAKDLKEQMIKLSDSQGLQFEIRDMDYAGSVENIQDSLLVIDCIDMSKNGVVANDVISMCDKSNVLCFLNADLAEVFFDDKYRRMFVPICIKKKLHNNSKLKLCRDECIWVYSENIKVRRMVYDFSVRKYLSRQGVEMFIDRISPSQGAEMFEYYSLLEFKRKFDLGGCNVK